METNLQVESLTYQQRIEKLLGEGKKILVQ